jgi:hypothetical protein
MEATEETESKFEHQEVPMEAATVETIKGMEDQHGGQYLSDCGSQKKLATTHTQTVAQNKGRNNTGPTVE